MTGLELEVLNALIGCAPDPSSLRAQVPGLMVTGGCECRCPTIYFAHGAKADGVVIEAEAAVTSTHDAVVLLVSARGELDALEYIWLGESPPSEFPPVSALEPILR